MKNFIIILTLICFASSCTIQEKNSVEDFNESSVELDKVPSYKHFLSTYEGKKAPFKHPFYQDILGLDLREYMRIVSITMHYSTSEAPSQYVRDFANWKLNQRNKELINSWVNDRRLFFEAERDYLKPHKIESRDFKAFKHTDYYKERVNFIGNYNDIFKEENAKIVKELQENGTYIKPINPFSKTKPLVIPPRK